MSYDELKCRVILAAGGNPTGIIEFADDGERTQYPEIARHFMSRDPAIEQFGFLETGSGGIPHFQMSGGEFCGNAARAASWLLSQKTGKQEGQFTMSGFDGVVQYLVAGSKVRCDFPRMKPRVIAPQTAAGYTGQLVDMGGIVHFVLDPKHVFNPDPAAYKEAHAQITEALGLGGKPAVGVIWREGNGAGVTIHPVVWVRDIDSFFYETACGSGTLAVLALSDVGDIVVTQPSGQDISGAKDENAYTLVSEVSEEA